MGIQISPKTEKCNGINAILIINRVHFIVRNLYKTSDHIKFTKHVLN